MKREELVLVAKESAAAGADVAETAFRTDIPVEFKESKTDVVTQADREAQHAIIDRIQQTLPDDTIVGEEGETAEALAVNGRTWIIDPIDGTNNYIRGNRRWATSVTCVQDGDPIVAVNDLPALHDRFVATQDGVYRNDTQVTVSDRSDPETFQVAPGIWWPFDERDEYAMATSEIVNRFGDLRRPGSAQAELSMLAAGAIEGLITNVETNPWDTVGGAAMVEWAGGTVTDLNGNPWQPDCRGIVASNGTAHQTLLEAVAEVEAVRKATTQ